MRKRAAEAEQVPMCFSKRGGARVGAGRPKKRDRGVTHDKRPELSGREPVHVTLRVLEHVYNLRTRRCFEVVFAAMIACCRLEGFRVVGLTVQGHHLHLLVEASSAAALAHGIKAISVRLAKGLNRLMGRRGPVFERFHARVLENPRQVRAAMRYILRNTAKHAAQTGHPLPADSRDPYTAGYFGSRVVLPDGTAAMVAAPETWLLREGWKRGAAPCPGAVRRDVWVGTAAVPPGFTATLRLLRSAPSSARKPGASERRDRQLPFPNWLAA